MDCFQDVQAILFDLDNTLIDTKGIDKVGCEKVCRYLEDRSVKKSVAEDVVKKFYESVRKSPQDPVEGRTSVDLWRTRLWSQALGPKLTCHSERAYAIWKEERMKHMIFSKRVKTMLLGLRQKYKLGLITNGPSDAQREKLDRVDACKYFDVILISGDFDRPKPDKFMFKLAFKWLGVSSEECIMVGDKLETDIAGGINARVNQTFLISPKDCTLWDDMDLKPDFVIDHVCDIMKYLGVEPDKGGQSDTASAKENRKAACGYLRELVAARTLKLD